MDKKAFYKMTYGLFVLTANDDGKDNGCIINTAIQAASDPLLFSICVIRGNHTCDMILNSGKFNISALTTDADFSLFKRFGMQSGRDVDKFDGFDGAERSDNGLLYITDSTNMYMSCKVVESKDLGSHVMFLAKVEDAVVLSQAESCSYAYYQSDIKPKPAAKPVSEKKSWVCGVCGYIYEGDEVPDDFLCPLCGHGKDDFTLVVSEPAASAAAAASAPAPAQITEPASEGSAKWVCTVCGYIYEGPEPPAECPVCHATTFNKIEGELTLAAEHEYGIYDKTVKNNPDISDEDKKYIFDLLMANFNGECSEVGMYLCMARIAHREGYPEIGLYWEKAAYEEAEHAAKFAELLGEDLESNMKASTKANLAWRVDCEFGATQGKVDLAMCAKKNGLDAIHDTVHEMARDEARHGKALKGLLERYFG